LLLASLCAAGTFKVPVVTPRAFPVGGFVLPVLRPDFMTVTYGPGMPILSPLPKSEPLALSRPLSKPQSISEQLGRLAGGVQEENKDKTGEASAADIGKIFDGTDEAPAGPVYVPPEQREVPKGELPGYLSVADADDRAWVTDVVSVSMQTKTGRKVLGQIKALAAKQGRPLTIVVAQLRANNGEYVYDWGMVRMNSQYRKLDAFRAAPIFMHELLHVVQFSHELPVDSVETELEAFVITLRMIRELNLRPKANSFEDMANRALRKSAADFVKYVTRGYSENRGLHPGGIKGYVEWVRAKRKRKLQAIARLEKKIVKERETIADMRKSGQPAEQVDTYEKDRIGELERAIKEHGTALGWMDRDLAMLATPEGADRYRKFAARVSRMIRNDQGS
jgi:hypothetical protein